MSNNIHLDQAISALSQAINSVSKRIENNDHESDQLLSQRRLFTIEAAELLAPDLSIKTLDILRIEVPQFVTEQVKSLLSSSHKFLGIFMGQAYRHNLSLLRAKLASELDRIQYGLIKELDAQIAEIAEQNRLLNIKLNDTTEIVKAMQNASMKEVTLSPDLMDHITQINSSSSRYKSTSSRQTSTPGSQATVVHNHYYTAQ